jgi:hypothetical protein
MPPNTGKLKHLLLSGTNAGLMKSAFGLFTTEAAIKSCETRFVFAKIIANRITKKVKRFFIFN